MGTKRQQFVICLQNEGCGAMAVNAVACILLLNSFPIFQVE